MSCNPFTGVANYPENTTLTMGQLFKEKNFNDIYNLFKKNFRVADPEYLSGSALFPFRIQS